MKQDKGNHESIPSVRSGCEININSINELWCGGPASMYYVVSANIAVHYQ